MEDIIDDGGDNGDEDDEGPVDDLTERLRDLFGSGDQTAGDGDGDENLSQKTPQTLLTQLNHNLRLNQKKYKRAGQNQQLQHKKVEEQK